MGRIWAIRKNTSVAVSCSQPPVPPWRLKTVSRDEALNLQDTVVFLVDTGVFENSVPLNPMVLLIIIPIKWLFVWEYTLFSDKPILRAS